MIYKIIKHSKVFKKKERERERATDGRNDASSSRPVPVRGTERRPGCAHAVTAPDGHGS